MLLQLDGKQQNVTNEIMKYKELLDEGNNGIVHGFIKRK